MSERHELIGQRVELRQKAQGLKTELEIKREALRRLLNPVADVAGIDAVKLSNLSSAFLAEQAVLAEITAQIKVLDEHLGG